MPRFLFPLLACLVLAAPSVANPVAVPYSNNFDTTDASDFFCPTGNGYNWGWDWRTGKFLNWVTASSRTVTGTTEARALGGPPATATDFLMKVTVDPVTMIGSGHSIGFGACGSNRELSEFYLADVAPAANTLRVLRISGGNTNLVAARAIQNLSLTDLQPFELELVGTYSGSSITLTFTVRKDGQSDTAIGVDSNVLTGDHFGLRNRNGGSGASYEVHLDDYELRPLDLVHFTSEPVLFAPLGELYTYAPLASADPPAATSQSASQLPVWAAFDGTTLSGTPAAGQTGQHPVVLDSISSGAADQQEFVITVPLPTGPLISEFMADNDDTLDDGDGDSSDWIELFNPTSTDLDLTGWFLTDDPAVPMRWPLPAGTIVPALGFKLFFASGKLLPDHANFALNNKAGSYLALVRPDGSVQHAYPAYPRQDEDISYGVYGDYATEGYLLEATPLEPNALIGYLDFVKDTTFTIDRGFYNSPFDTTIACATPGATIVYTLDGSTPTLGNGTLVPAPDGATPPSVTVNISSTTILRAAAFKTGFAPANTDTQTYLFLDDIRTQNANGSPPPGWPSGSLNGQVFNYGMDPDVINAITVQDFEDAMTDIGTISLVTDLPNFIDPEDGIWTNAEHRGPEWERPFSIELLNGDGTPGFQVDGGARVRGGFSRQGSNPKHSFHLYFKEKYGDGKLRYPLFGLEGADEFDRIDLRASQGRSWHWSASADATFNRDVFGRDLQRDMGQPYARSRYYHVYVNAIYFGVFQTQERTDKFFGDSYFGGGADNWDVMKTRTRPHRVEALDGDPEAWGRLYDAAVAGFATDAAYYAAQGLDVNGEPDPAGENLIDVDNLIDYMLAIFFTGQSDGPVNLGANVPKNFFAMRPRDGRFGFRFFVHDNEDSLGGSPNNTVNNDTGERLTHFNPKWLHQRLTTNPNYVRRFGDRAHKHLFNDGAFTAGTAVANFQRTSDMLQKAIIGESARWGDYKSATPYTQATWQNAVNGKITSWIPQRGPTLLGQLRNAGLYPAPNAPVFSQHGGSFPVGGSLALNTSNGDIHYTLDGSDPIDPGAIVIPGGGSSTTLLARSLGGWKHFASLPGLSNSDVVSGHPSYPGDWKNPSYNDSSWQDVVMPIGYDDVGLPPVTTTISYGSDPNNRYITYYARRKFDVTGAAGFSSVTLRVRRDDGIVAYFNGVEVGRSNLPAGLITPTTTTPTFATGADETNFFEFPIDPADLLEGTNTLAIELHNNSSTNTDLVLDAEVIASTSSGTSITLNATTTVKARTLDGGVWSALTEATFFTTAPASASSLRITEIHYNPPGASEALEFLELRNISNEAIHLDETVLSGGVTFQFPPGLVLQPGQYLLLVNDRVAFESVFGPSLPVVGEYGGNLANSGDELILIGAEGDLIQQFTYRDDLPWSELADGTGPSLVFIGGDPNEAGSWRPSTAENGNPGSSDSTVFTGDPNGDDDQNGLSNFLQYAIGTEGTPWFYFVERNGEWFVAFSHQQRLAADDVLVTPQTSLDLQSWSNLEPSEFALVAELLVAPGLVERHYERILPGVDSRRFLRLQVEARP